MLQNNIVAMSGKAQISFLIADNLQNIKNSLYGFQTFLTAAHIKKFIFIHASVHIQHAACNKVSWNSTYLY